MKGRSPKIAVVVVGMVLAAALASTPAFAAKGKPFVGIVSDSMCGAKHMMPGDAAGCTRECVSKGSKYALVVGDKVYTLETSDKAALAALDKRAGVKATITGTEKDGTIAVSSVAAAP
jgi:hypothetical protein